MVPRGQHTLAVVAIACAVAGCRRAPADLTRELPADTWLAAHIDLARLRDGDLPPEVAKVLAGCGLDTRAGYLEVAVAAKRVYVQTRSRIKLQQVRCALTALDVAPSTVSLRHDAGGDRMLVSFDIDAGARTPLDEAARERFRADRGEPIALAMRLDGPGPAWTAALAGRDLELTMPSDETAWEAYGGTQLAVDEPSILRVALDGSVVRYHAEGGLFGEDATTAVRRRVADTLAIPGPAMEPTLQAGDAVAFLKPKLAGPATRGDIVVFTREGQDHVRRILGVPGDRVRIDRGMFSLDGKPVPSRIVALAHTLVDPPRRFERQRWSETVGAMSYEITRADDASPEDRELEVPAERLYVSGDARADSSRELIPAISVRGRAIMIAWSRGPDGVRWDRIGRWIGRAGR